MACQSKVPRLGSSSSERGQQQGCALDGVRRRKRHGKGLGVACVVALAVLPTPAWADVSSWMFVGGGLSHADGSGDADSGEFGALQVDAGLGTPADGSWVLGGVFHGIGYFGYGADLGAAFRVTTGGFSRGDWGLGLDLGPEYRFADESTVALGTRALVGLPWGFTLTGGASWGTDDSRAFSVVFGLDLARLSVHRGSGLSWFQNPLGAPQESLPYP